MRLFHTFWWQSGVESHWENLHLHWIVIIQISYIRRSTRSTSITRQGHSRMYALNLGLLPSGPNERQVGSQRTISQNMRLVRLSDAESEACSFFFLSFCSLFSFFLSFFTTCVISEEYRDQWSLLRHFATVALAKFGLCAKIIHVAVSHLLPIRQNNAHFCG